MGEHKNNTPKKKRFSVRTAVALGCVVLTFVLAAALVWGGGEKTPDNDGQTPGYTGSLSINVGSGLTVVDIGPYTGMYMEDGSDELVSGVLLCIVRNDGERAVEYAQLKLHDGEKDIPFTLTALLPGRSVVLLAQDKTEYSQSANYTATMAESVAFFVSEPSLQTERIEVQGLSGGMNVRNISQSDIAGDVVVYYKNAAKDGLLYGGITYRARISGGLKAGELKQGMTEHFRLNGSEVLFVTVAE